MSSQKKNSIPNILPFWEIVSEFDKKVNSLLGKKNYFEKTVYGPAYNFSQTLKKSVIEYSSIKEEHNDKFKDFEEYINIMWYENREEYDIPPVPKWYKTELSNSSLSYLYHIIKERIDELYGTKNSAIKNFEFKNKKYVGVDISIIKYPSINLELIKDHGVSDYIDKIVNVLKYLHEEIYNNSGFKFIEAWEKGVNYQKKQKNLFSGNSQHSKKNINFKNTYRSNYYYKEDMKGWIIKNIKTTIRTNKTSPKYDVDFIIATKDDFCKVFQNVISSKKVPPFMFFKEPLTYMMLDKNLACPEFKEYKIIFQKIKDIKGKEIKLQNKTH